MKIYICRTICYIEKPRVLETFETHESCIVSDNEEVSNNNCIIYRVHDC